ncbi:LAETG motif-containing sortase-dependent surface protein [Streptomyces sp. NPDC056503]|uniref:LAETG motif-containing sortase-dependent surface protein n=1 Tax=Streptomyces sp. NPDC056503 TaxID=3345842 RepID=UPI003677BEFB
MTTSPRWRSVLASAATVAALVVAPLAGAGTALAMDDPHPSKPSHPYPPKPDHPYPPKPHHPYPPKPPKPHHPGKPHHGDHPHGPHLADTGDDNSELILGGVAAGLVAAGAGTVLVVRRRRHS